ncbi:MAG: AAA family ATPase [Syntrophomonas sp.]
MLDRIELSGFKSIKKMELELNSLNVLIGANGAGKSNLISFFKMFNHMMSRNLQQYIGQSGYADALLYYGAKRTPQMTATLNFSTKSGVNYYYMRLVSAAQGTLIFADEAVSFSNHKIEGIAPLQSLGGGHKESCLIDDDSVPLIEGSKRNQKTAHVIKSIMQRWRVYHFHDTSSAAFIKNPHYIEDNKYLRHDAGNLAAFLFQMKQKNQPYYRRIVETIQSVTPFFEDFILYPSTDNLSIFLNWRERGGDPEMVFGPHQLSDGTLRLMALITLLLQPSLPDLIVIDEPELGLHPYAISVLAALLKSISSKTQIIVSTQSVTLVDQLEPENIVVVDREDNQSVFRRLDVKKLDVWLEEYSLGELWEKNVLGGRPAR